MREETGQWLKQAEFELETAKILLDNNRFSSASFHAQQAAEMGLKAMHVEKGKPIKSHDLIFLIKTFKAPLNIEKAAKELCSVYQETRYPDMTGRTPSEEFSEIETESDIHKAEAILKWVKQNLK